MQLQVVQPSRVTVMIKPVGALCNLDCTYCYYLPTKTIFDGHGHGMSPHTLEDIFASILPRFDNHVTIAWQGGEPTLAGLDFFKKMIEFQHKYKKPGQQIDHALQTKGTLLNDEWCEFLRENRFLIGLSVDGPAHFHDHYRLTNRKTGSLDLVMRGHKLLQKHAVDYNILCVLNDRNVHHPEEILQYLLKLGSRWVQFIPAIEWEKDPKTPDRNVLAPYSPDPEAFGHFLNKVFDLWFEKYRKRVSVRLFDAVLNKLVLGQMPFCINDASCHNQLTIEHDGAVFGCDHFVERRWQLGQIGDPEWNNDINFDGSQNIGLTIHGDGYKKNEAHAGRDINSADDMSSYSVEMQQDGVDEAWFDRVEQERLGHFAKRKQHLPETCFSCEYKAFCHGGCPKHRSMGGEIPEPTILCESYKLFYGHSLDRLKWLAGYLQRGQQPPDPETPQRQQTPPREPAMAMAGGGGKQRVKRNDPCPCGSGIKYKNCHGRH